MKTKVLSVVANSTERPDGPAFGLVKAVENAVSEFISSVKGTLEGFELAGTVIDSGAGNANDPNAVFGRTLVIVRYEGGSKRKSSKK